MLVHDGYKCSEWIINFTQVGFDCWSRLDTNVKDEYECWTMDTNVDKGWIQMSIQYGYEC